MTYRTIFVRCLVILFVIVAIAAVAALWVPLARAQEVCMPFDKAVAALEKQYQEQMIGAGISANNDYIYQLFMHRTGRTWTLLRTDRKGETCFIAAGKDWSEIDAWAIQPQSIDHHTGNAPHSWIQPKMNGAGISCCGPGDVAEVPNWAVSGIDVGGEVTAVFPSHGEQTVTVRRVYPSEDARSYITFYGCLLKQFGI